MIAAIKHLNERKRKTEETAWEVRTEAIVNRIAIKGIELEIEEDEVERTEPGILEAKEMNRIKKAKNSIEGVRIF